MANWKEIAKQKKVKHHQIVSWFFDHASDTDNFTCKACKECYKCRHYQTSGYANLFAHLERMHPAFQDITLDALEKDLSGNLNFTSMNSSKMKDAVNLYRWIEWVLMSDLPFSFVDNDITRSNSGLDPITSKALLEGMEYLSRYIEKKIKTSLPPSFGIIFDGWSEAGTHFLAMFASFYNPDSKLADSKGGCYPLLAMSPLLDESSFTADEHITYMKEMLSFYGKTMKDVAYFVADNCETNQSMERYEMDLAVPCTE